MRGLGRFRCLRYVCSRLEVGVSEIVSVRLSGAGVAVDPAAS
jgi:hypothetical protein